MSKRSLTLVAGALLLASTASVFAQSGSNYRGATPPPPSQQASSSARKFYSYTPSVRGQRTPPKTYVRPASAKALGNY